MSKYIIAHDLGTSGNKATLFSTDGKMIDSIVCPYDTHYFNQGWAEQHPEDWWQAVCSTTKAMAARVNQEDIIAMSFSGHMMGCLPVDIHGKPLREHILWADMRATEEEAEIGAKVDLMDFYHIVGHRLSASYTLAKILWIKKNEPQIYAKTYKFLHAKDYMVYRLTGKMMTDYSDASGSNMFDLNEFVWSKKILDAAGIDIEKLPDPMPSTTVAGYVLPEAAAECGLSTHTRVVIGAGDGATATVGAGCIREGQAYACLGTSAWVGCSTKHMVCDNNRILTNWAHAVPGLVMPLSTMQAAGGSFSWVKNHICLSETEQAKAAGKSPYSLINDEIASAPAGSNGLLFLPYLMGERSPRWNTEAKGCFIGLKMTNTRADMLRSVIEGIGFNLRVILDTQVDCGISIQELSLVGGMAQGAIERQILADIWNRPVLQLNYIEEAGSIGAAIIAGVGVGEFASFDAVSSFIHPVSVQQPDPSVSQVYSKQYQAFNHAYKVLCPVFSELS